MAEIKRQSTLKRKIAPIEIVKLRDKGLSYEEIGLRLNISRSMAHKMLKRWRCAEAEKENARRANSQPQACEAEEKQEQE